MTDLSIDCSVCGLVFFGDGLFSMQSREDAIPIGTLEMPWPRTQSKHIVSDRYDLFINIPEFLGTYRNIDPN
jgi:hypothetical protein